MDDTGFKAIEKQLILGKDSLDSVLKGVEQVNDWLEGCGLPDSQLHETTQAHSANLGQLHAWLKEKDPSFGGLVRVQNKQHEFLWVHPQFVGEY